MTGVALIQPLQSVWFRPVSHSYRLLPLTAPLQPETPTRRSAPSPPAEYPVDASRSVSRKNQKESSVGGESPPRRAVPFTSAKNAR